MPTRKKPAPTPNSAPSSKRVTTTRAKTSKGAGKTPTTASTPARKPPVRRYTKAQIRRNQIIALAVVALAIVGMVFLIKWAAGLFAQWQASQAAEAKAYQLKMAQRTFDPPEKCEAEALEVTLEGFSPLVSVGAGNSAKLSVKNTGKVPCLTEYNPAQSGWEIRSGNQIIANSAACQGSEVAGTPLLLGTGMTWTHQVHWDALVHNSDCSASANVAQSGTYRAQALWNGKAVGKESVFAIQDHPVAQPQNQSAEQTGNGDQKDRAETGRGEDSAATRDETASGGKTGSASPPPSDTANG